MYGEGGAVKGAKHSLEHLRIQKKEGPGTSLHHQDEEGGFQPGLRACNSTYPHHVGVGQALTQPGG